MSTEPDEILQSVHSDYDQRFLNLGFKTFRVNNNIPASIICEKFNYTRIE